MEMMMCGCGVCCLHVEKIEIDFLVKHFLEGGKRSQEKKMTWDN